MQNIRKKDIVAAIVARTAATPAQATRAVEAILGAMKQALADEKTVDLGKLGTLKTVTRRPQHRVTKNLKNVCPTVIHLHTRHPKSVRLTNATDLSENPLPTLVYPPEPVKKVIRRRAAIALPAWRRRIR